MEVQKWIGKWKRKINVAKWSRKIRKANVQKWRQQEWDKKENKIAYDRKKRMKKKVWK